MLYSGVFILNRPERKVKSRRANREENGEKFDDFIESRTYALYACEQCEQYLRSSETKSF